MMLEFVEDQRYKIRISKRFNMHIAYGNFGQVDQVKLEQIPLNLS